MKRLVSILMIILFPYFLYSSENAPVRNLTGIVKDKSTKEIIDNASVFIYGTNRGVTTNALGEFVLEVKFGDIISVTFLGYKPQTYFVDTDTPAKILIELEDANYNLSEVVIKPGKERYRKKGNPAVEFVEKVIAHKKLNSPYEKDYYSYQRYEKLTYSLNNFDSIKLNKRFYRKFNFLKNYIDTSDITHKPILTVSTREQLENNYYDKNSGKKKTVIEAYKRDGLDEMIPEENINAITKEIFGEVNIFNNDIYLLTNKFVSPLSNIAPSFYKFYLMDTVYIDGVKHQDLGFVPMNSESLGFTGHLYVTLDSTYFVKQVKFNFAHDINLNFVNSLNIEQEFERTSDSIRIIVKDDLTAEFSIFKNVEGILCKKVSSYNHHSFDRPADISIFKEHKEVITNPEAKYRKEDYWKSMRHFEIKEKENAVDKLLGELRSIPVFYYTEKGISWIVDGYIPTRKDSSRFDIGPINTMYSYNTFEGSRFRLGGYTTANLSPNLFAGGYVAYGTKDEKFKYMGELEYSFNKKTVHRNEYPLHSIKASYRYDVDQLGQHYMTNQDNIVLSLKRKSDDRSIYLRTARLEYKREHEIGLSYSLGASFNTNYATHCVQFDKYANDGFLINIPHYNVAEAEFKIRFAPKEKYYQMKARRLNLNPSVPIFTLTQTIGKKGVLGSDYSVNRTQFSFQKRQWLSFMGYIDMQCEIGKIWNKAPYTLLNIPNANLSYTIQPGTYSLMNPLEFINDEYVSWDVTYFMNGLILNRIPLIKHLKWREVANFKGIKGNLSDKNKPAPGNDLLIFPNGSGEMGKTPYMECSVGIENIFKLLRVDYVWRLNYRNAPNIDKSGVRISMHITF